MTTKCIKFYRPIGPTVPGGPFATNTEYFVDDIVLKHFLVKALLAEGNAVLIDSVGSDAKVQEPSPAAQGKPDTSALLENISDKKVKKTTTK